jgi:hypothetical protein
MSPFDWVEFGRTVLFPGIFTGMSCSFNVVFDGVFA